MVISKYSCFDKKFVSRWLVFSNTLKESALAKLDDCKFQRQKIIQHRWKDRWLRVFFRNNHSTSERTHDWYQLFLEINILLLKWLLKKWMTASPPVQMKTVSLRNGWLLLFLWQKQIPYFKGRMDIIRLVK